MLRRREILKFTAALAGSTAISPRIFARQQLSLNSLTVDLVTDGRMQLPARMLASDYDNADVQAYLKSVNAPSDQITPPCNLTLVQTDSQKVLFDVGGGTNFMPNLGKISDSLAAIDIEVSDITDVVFTHAHPDHIWGLLDDFDDLLFSNANYHMASKEFNYWMDPNTVNQTPEDRQAFAAGAKRNLEIIADQISLFEDGAEIIPGIAAFATNGHTPGHTSFEVGSGSEGVMIIGDAINNTLVSVPHPEWRAPFDQEPDEAMKTRQRLLNRLAAEKMAVIAYHFDEAPFGQIEKDASGYRYVSG